MGFIQSIQNKLQFIFSRKAATVNLKDSAAFYSTFTDFFNLGKSNVSSWVADCCDIYGKALMKTSFDLYDDTSEEKTEIEKHPIKDIISKPNPFQYWSEILYNIGYQAGIYGESFLYKLRDGLGITRGLLLLPNSSVTIETTFTMLDCYSVSFRSGVVKVPIEDMIHLRYPNPEVSTKGKPIVANILDIVEVDKLQTAYQKKFYEKGGFMGLTFATDTNLSSETFKQKAKQFSEVYGGINKAFKVGLLDSGFKPVNPSHTIKDMDISNQRALTRDEILAAFQISKFQLGMGESINRATAKEIQMRFAADVIEPLLCLYDNILTQSLCKTERGWEYLEIKHESTSPRDLDTDSQWYDAMRNNGAITPNEVRVYEDLEPIEDERMNIPIVLQKQITSQIQNAN